MQLKKPIKQMSVSEIKQVIALLKNQDVKSKKQIEYLKTASELYKTHLLIKKHINLLENAIENKLKEGS